MPSHSVPSHRVQRLVDREPRVPPERLLAELAPPPRFAGATLASYLPDPGEPTQTAALAEVAAVASDLQQRPGAPGGWRRALSRRREGPRPQGIYLDGGFGVGKTHLLAGLWHASPPPKAFGTFVELTNLVGALGFAPTVQALAGHRLVCIDEFELDDPGDTVLMSSLLTRLTESGVRLAASSNTLPGALGQGRFAAGDFLREIQGLAAHFRVVRVDGPDYRHRGTPDAPSPLLDKQVHRRAETAGPDATLDEFPELLQHLRRLHPSRYGTLLDGISSVHLLGVAPVEDQSVALRLVVFADRLYDRDLPVFASGSPLDEVFPEHMLRGGYRKKYLRAISRLLALARLSESPTR